MKKRKSYLKQILMGFLLTLVPVFLTACPFCHGLGCGEGPTSLSFNQAEAEITQFTSPPNQTLEIQDDGTISVTRGIGCAESANGHPLKVEDSLNLPRYAGNATVYLNGWHLKYRNGKHNVFGLGTSIYNIRLEDGPTGKILRWNAGGWLADDDMEHPYEWCYSYAVVAWNPVNLVLVVDHDGDPFCGKEEGDPLDRNFFVAKNAGTTTALSSFPSFIRNPGFASSKTVAILPRGFASWWEPRSCDQLIDIPPTGPIDHEILQTAYNLDHGEVFMENGKKYQKGYRDTTRSDPSIVDRGYVSWETSTIFKDDDTRRDYVFGEIVSGLGGSEVGVVQPPFSILPVEDEWFCGATYGPAITDHEIHTVPYKYAIPMLTGWDLFRVCDDEKVQEIGVWIDDWSWDHNNPGILRYKLRHAGDNFGARHKVTVLGLRPVTIRPESP